MNDFLNCKECVDLLADLLEGNLDQATAERLQDHLACCPPCVNFVETYRSTSHIASRLRDKEVAVPKEIALRIKSFLHQNLEPR